MDAREPDDVRSRRNVLALGGALVAGAAAGATLLSPRVAQAANENSFKVGVVDMGTVFKQYQRKDHLEKQVNVKRDKLQNELKELETKGEGIRKRLDITREGTVAWRDLRKELKLAVKQYEVMRESQQEELNVEIETLTLQLLDEIEKGIREFGIEQKYDLIVKVDSSKGFPDEQVDPRGMGEERFRERIFRANVSSVLFVDPRLDVTQTIVAKINDPKWIKDCEQAKPAPAPSPSPPPPVQQPPPADQKGK